MKKPNNNTDFFPKAPPLLIYVNSHTVPAHTTLPHHPPAPRMRAKTRPGVKKAGTKEKKGLFDDFFATESTFGRQPKAFFTNFAYG